LRIGKLSTWSKRSVRIFKISQRGNFRDTGILGLAFAGDLDMHDAVREFWNTRDPEVFDSTAKSSGRMDAINRVAALAKPYVSKEGAVSMDLGCGTGLFADAVRTRDIIGVDFSPSLLVAARRRMDTVRQQNVFCLKLSKNSVDNIVSLFVMDDYQSEKKCEFFTQVFSFLKLGGHFFLAAYSPNDERMGRFREAINAKLGVSFRICLEDASFYKDGLQKIGFAIDESETVRANGVYQTGEESVQLKREFIVIVARKPEVVMKPSAE